MSKTKSLYQSDNKFKLKSPYSPRGDQPRAIDNLVSNLNSNVQKQVLLGVTGSGKTFSVANVIQEVNLPTLVIAHNKTLAAQLHSEFLELFPDNAVRYFVSYYDYYQPEAYVPSTDTYIEKDSSINDEIDKLRHSATKALLERNDVIVVASVSCIYGLGAAENYFEMMIYLESGAEQDRDQLLKKLVYLQYQRNDLEFRTGTFRVRGDVVEVCPASESERSIRVEFFGDEIEAIYEVERLTGKNIRKLEKACIYPASHFVTSREDQERAMDSIRAEMELRVPELERLGKPLESQRLEQRTRYDLELIEQMGFCPGIENYSRHLSGREEGESADTLIDYFPDDFLVVIDESHVTLPQLIGMYRGDRSRKSTLVDHGFRLPSALDNRPLKFDEFEEKAKRVIYVSATPGDYEIQESADKIVEQIIRPTGLLDPKVEVRPASNQVEDLLAEVNRVVDKGERALVTTLTKRMAEDLTEYYKEVGVRVRYLHSEVHTLDRIELIRGLREGEFDVLVGINLLREGLDLPEVSLVGILDADKEGFLRSETSLVQTIGRAARNVNGFVILYGDRITRSMDAAIKETNRRREIQHKYNEEHGITPKSVKRAPEAVIVDSEELSVSEAESNFSDAELPKDFAATKKVIEEYRKQMFKAAEDREFEKAAEFRDKIRVLEKYLLSL